MTFRKGVSVPRWTEQQIETLREMRADGCDWKEIAPEVGHGAGACEAKFISLRDGRGDRRIHKDTTRNARVSDGQLADRDARREASCRRTVTGEFFNDPPPGYSALDRKRAGGVA